MKFNFNIKTEDLGNWWVTSDLHIGHQNIIKYCNRPFASVEEMNEALVANWNSVVAPDDGVIVVGDVAMGKLDLSLPYVSRMNGGKVLVLGNHDRPYEGWYKGEKREEWRRRYEAAGFELQAMSLNLYIGEELKALVHHIPYGGDPEGYQRESFEKDKLVEHPDEGLPLICGHVHDIWTSQRSPKGTPMFNVGVDVHNYRPIALKMVLEELEKLKL